MTGTPNSLNNQNAADTFQALELTFLDDADLELVGGGELVNHL